MQAGIDWNIRKLSGGNDRVLYFDNSLGYMHVTFVGTQCMKTRFAYLIVCKFYFKIKVLTNIEL